jgi:transposase-like protein
VLGDLVKRGLQRPGTITTAGAAGVTKASDAIWPKALRLGCWFHKRPHLQQPGPPQAWPELKTLVAARRDAPTVPEAQRRRHRLGNRSQRDFPAACRCLRDEAQASLNHLYVPQRHPPYVRPSPLAGSAPLRRSGGAPRLFHPCGMKGVW